MNAQDLRVKLNSELLRNTAREVILPHIDKQVVFLVVGEQLVQAGVSLATDDVEQVKAWLEDGTLKRPDQAMLDDWERRDTTFAALIVKPWVLIQEEPEKKRPIPQ